MLRNNVGTMHKNNAVFLEPREDSYVNESVHEACFYNPALDSSSNAPFEADKLIHLCPDEVCNTSMFSKKGKLDEIGTSITMTSLRNVCFDHCQISADPICHVEPYTLIGCLGGLNRAPHYRRNSLVSISDIAFDIDNFDYIPCVSPSIFMDDDTVPASDRTDHNSKLSYIEASMNDSIHTLKQQGLYAHQNDIVSLERLKKLMNNSRESQHRLEAWDKRNGLPKSHSCTMMHTNRSRRQLEEGRILKKWNGAPLISHAKGTGFPGGSRKRRQPNENISRATKKRC